MTQSEIGLLTHEMIAECEAAELRTFEEAIAGASPVEQTVLRRLREKLQTEQAKEDAEYEKLVSHGDGSAKAPEGVIYP